MPHLFSRRKKVEKKTSRVTTFRDEQEKQVVEAVEAGLFPARVASRNGVKTVQFTMKVVIIAVGLLVIASYLGLIDPIRQFFRPIQSGSGTLIVSTDYVRAQVSLDGKILGQTPFTGESIKPGTYTLKVAAAENPSGFFKESEIGIVINPGNATIVKANPAPDHSLFSYTVISSKNREAGDSLLIVKAIPQDTKISIDGNTVGEAPFISETISVGAHQLLLNKEGYKPVLLDITIAEDKVVTIDSKLYEYQVKLDR